MVREILRDVLAQRQPSAPSTGPVIESVRIASDADLQAFVSRLLDAAIQGRIKAGQLRFSLAQAGSPAPAAPQPQGAALTGVVTEKTIDRQAGGPILVLAADAVLTPLARDRARRLGLKIERRS